MVKISIDYQGQLRSQAVHSPSGTTLTTDAPVDNNGKGESFSPTDLCATALGSCMATIIGMQTEALGIDLSGMRIEVSKAMSADLPRRIVELVTEIWLPIELDAEQQKLVEKAALTCPVHYSLHPEIAKPIQFHWK
ncbi:MAG: OsmC family protein [Coraliomargarita sp.]